ncbi:hypothetical protein P9D84_13385 [Bacillus vallismortis]|uniref:hypothetical protein n=1 Tax=Bacillus vallismortis TaxID=72361 RepID=UPI002DBA461E|nr:hypothetical protein [Bacillus vallismortis]MEC1792351.1 hypothetical protein [Bacillus vallismortis]
MTDSFELLKMSGIGSVCQGIIERDSDYEGYIISPVFLTKLLKIKSLGLSTPCP